MEIEFDENGVFELKIGCNKLVFEKRDDGCVSITMPYFYNETTQQLSGLVNNVLCVSGTDEMKREFMNKSH